MLLVEEERNGSGVSVQRRSMKTLKRSGCVIFLMVIITVVGSSRFSVSLNGSSLLTV